MRFWNWKRRKNKLLSKLRRKDGRVRGINCANYRNFFVAIGVYIFKVGDFIESNTSGGPFLSCFIMAVVLFSVGLMCMFGG